MEKNIRVKAGPQALNIMKNNTLGQIYSVHSSSFYCLFDDEGILLFHEAHLGIIPFGLAVQDLSHLLNGWHLKKEMTLVCGDDGFSIPELNLRFVPDEEAPDGRSAFTIAKKQEICVRLLQATEILDEKGSKNGLGGLVLILDDILTGSFKLGTDSLNLFCRSCSKPLAGLIQGIEEENAERISDSLDHLMGLGPGLTPSMDDILVGLLCTYGYLGDNMALKDKGWELLKKYVFAKSRLRTSFISASYLRSAAEGERFTLIDQAVRSIVAAPFQDHDDKAYHQLLKVGSNSGTEMLLGIIIAIRLIFKITS